MSRCRTRATAFLERSNSSSWARATPNTPSRRHTSCIYVYICIHILNIYIYVYMHTHDYIYLCMAGDYVLCAYVWSP